MKRLWFKIISSAIIISLITSNASIFAVGTKMETIDLSEQIFSIDTPITQFPSNIGLNSSKNSDSSLYGSRLDANNKAVYDAMKAWINPSEKSLEPLKINFPMQLTVLLEVLPNEPNFGQEDADKLLNAMIKNCKNGRDSFIFDYPEVFWFDPTDMYFSYLNASYTYNPFEDLFTLYIGGIALYPELNKGFSDINEAIYYGSVLDNVLETFVPASSDVYGKLKEIHDKIIETTFYDLNGRFRSSVLGGLIEPGAVCEGYSKAFKLLCDRENIPCLLVFGNFVEDTGHMWNYVMMDDDKWYAVDVTWDDLDGFGGNQIDYEYFLKGSDFFFQEHQEEYNFDGSIFSYPVLSNTDYVYSPPVLKGDFNLDGMINNDDAALCGDVLTDRGDSSFVCDFDGDGIVNIFDLIMVREAVEQTSK